MNKINKCQNEKIIIFLTVLNIIIYLFVLIKKMIPCDISFLNNVIRVIIFADFAFNMCVYFRNKNYFKYKEGNSFSHQFWLLVCNVSRLVINFSFFILITRIILDLFPYAEYLDDINGIIVLIFAALFLWELIKFIFEGKLTFSRLVLIVLVAYLASITEVVVFAISSFGAKLIFDLIFSEDYVEYIKLTHSLEEVKLNKIKEHLNVIKYKWKPHFIYFIFSLNLVVVIKKNMPETCKKDILSFLRQYIYREVADFQNTELGDRIIIGGVVIVATVIVFSILYWLIYENVTKKFLKIEVDK